MSHKFLIPLPTSIASDQELAPYFNFLNKVIHDLGEVGPAVDDAGDVTGYAPHASGAVAVLSAAATDLDATAAALDTLVTEVEDIKTQLNLLLQILREREIIAP